MQHGELVCTLYQEACKGQKGYPNYQDRQEPRPPQPAELPMGNGLAEVAVTRGALQKNTAGGRVDGGACAQKSGVERGGGEFEQPGSWQHMGKPNSKDDALCFMHESPCMLEEKGGGRKGGCFTARKLCTNGRAKQRKDGSAVHA